ncbi:5'-AMP-activated protein kinase beta subunit, interation domain-containing protein [Debaryomyces fabryi]|uniref:5'-AMP-activated protein kinase beta subunit, interation domain-containing protein n=1 Tax=Debaryomyces fabryi TaxID=58627 RepID=A0A0V1PXZ2_9ASCO|nr:5'-AMP-activated protein kinase beta subunit, interation domain-containing protein [Debaryomyces fabryi]KSA00970.1 5'-AMP-activated protein kinase beta subunit, interation domain-containing protein [Debaryomyces fabryi]CUM49763.1 unnamed protein product [Debaryomyces fabryi]
MGNNTSSTRKSTASRYNLGNIRKSSTSTNNYHNLDEEFSDLILHQVKRKQDEKHGRQKEQQNEPSGIHTQNSSGTDGSNRSMQQQYHQFSNDLIEDEFNELNAGLLDVDGTEVARNILPNSDYNSDAMDTSEDHSISSGLSMPQRGDTPTPNLSKVDFTKIAVAPSNAEDVNMNSYVASPVGKSNISSKSKNGRRIPVEIKWVNSNKENILKISIIGSFSNWRNIIHLSQSSQHENEYVTTIKLPLGVHKLLYIINNEYRVSDQLPTATDHEGIFFNWFEVLDEVHLFNHSHNQPNHVGASSDYDANIILSLSQGETQTAGRYEVDKIRKKLNSFLAKVSKSEAFPDVEHVEYMPENSPSPAIGPQTVEELVAPRPYAERMQSDDCSTTTNESNKYVPYHEKLSSSFLADYQKSALSYSSEIPEMFVNYDYFKSKGPDYELPEPPQLPAHLNNVLLNKMSSNQQQNHAQNIPMVPPTITDHQHYQQVQQIQSSQYPYDYQTSSVVPNNSSKRPPLRRADSSYYASNQEAYHLSIPNHVILNHLMTTSIRNDVLIVACITRYSGKFVTQIMHSPADT